MVSILLIYLAGLFDSSINPEFIRKEIFGCIDMARHGIHGVLVVFSVSSRFSVEETAVISSLVTFFGNKIYDYMIVVFTCGDELDHHKKTLENFLSTIIKGRSGQQILW